MAFKLTHPDSDQEIEREEGDVPTYLSQGWKTKPGAKIRASTTTAVTAKNKE